jgi:ABC-type sugar transport system ATPase subunit
MTDAGQQAIGHLSIRTPDGARAVKLHSGGNQQKVLVGKWLNRKRSVRS